ncbi:unnamed protein product [Staurois parvus]|uniref:Uncharacterized protein n=1 Tax=Staurois parvus TaxID=386267 RepID=A0ABN9E2R2_9NEOB|nr:unnamed protein product [Staurois parvus]
MRGDQRVNCVLGVFYYGAVCLCFTVSTLLCMAVLCTAIQSSVHELTGRTVFFLQTVLLLIGDPWQSPGDGE